jgi:hypothetical protein
MARLCVRYRRSADGSHRYTTVELIVDCMPIKPDKNYGDIDASRARDRVVGVRIRYEETQLRSVARANGATWDGTARLWRMPLRAAKRLGLAERVVVEN